MLRGDDVAMPAWIWELRERAQAVERGLDSIKEMLIDRYSPYEGWLLEELVREVMTNLTRGAEPHDLMVQLRTEKGMGAKESWKLVELCQACLHGELTSTQLSMTLSQLV